MERYLQKKYVLACLLLVISFFSVINLFQPGYPLTHDGDVHLLRLTNFYQSLQEGHSVPRWAANVNFGFGQPVFEFFYPMPYYLASAFHLMGLPFSDGLKLVLLAGMVLSSLAMFIWLSELFNEEAGFVGGLLYLFAPFRFVDTYVRGDVGENLSFVFIPLVLWSIYTIEKRPTFLWSILGGIFFSCLILTHNVVSLIALPFILFYALFCFYHHNKRKLFGGYIFWMFFIGFALSAFFWLPGLIEGKYTLRNIVTMGEYRNRFTDIKSLLYGPWSYGGSGEFTVQLGLLQWCSLLVSFLFLPFLLRKKHKNRALVIGTLVYVVLGIFFMLPNSSFIWSKLLILQNFQFPWRFLVVTTFGTAILGGYLVQYIPKKFTVFVVSIVAILVLLINREYMHARSFVKRPDAYFAGIQRAPADTGESSPIWSVRFMEKGFNHPLEVINGDASIKQMKRTTTEHLYSVQVYKKSRLLENTLYFPGWQIVANGMHVPVEFQDEQYRGLMTFYLNPGTYTLNATFIDTKFRKMADIISLGTGGIILFLGVFLNIWQKKKHSNVR